MDESISKFIETILAQSDVDIHTPEGEYVAKEIERHLADYVGQEIVGILPQEKVDEYLMLIEHNVDISLINHFLEQNIPNAQEWLTDKLITFARMYVEEDVQPNT